LRQRDIDEVVWSEQQKLEKEVFGFKCGCKEKPLDGSLHSYDRGGCLRGNFKTESGFHDDLKLYELLLLYREKTKDKNRFELDIFGLNLFKQHVTNLPEVIKSTASDRELLFGKSYREIYCGQCNIQPPCECTTNDGTTIISALTSGSQSSLESTSLSKKSRKNIVFDHDWSVVIDTGFLPYGKNVLRLCRASICFLYGIHENVLKRCSQRIRAENTPDLGTITKTRDYDHKTYFGDEFTIQDIETIFEDNGIDLGVQARRAALVRASDIHIDAKDWMEQYFDKFCYDPTSKNIHIDVSYKRSIWEEYKNQQNLYRLDNVSLDKFMTPKHLSEGQFKTLWGSLFSNVKIRETKRVSGKCWTCAYINELRHKHKSNSVA
jgi:hypothetical protein